MSWPVRFEYHVTRSAILDFCAAIGESHPWCVEPGVAHAAGYRDLVAPPMFAAVYAMPAISTLQHDPATGFDYERAVHGGQEFRWDPAHPVLAGDTIVTEARLSEVHERGALRFFTMLSRSTGRDGAAVSQGIWSAIVRGADQPDPSGGSSDD